MKVKILTIALSVITLSARAQYQSVAPNPYGERPVIVPVPTTVQGISNACTLLNKEWQSDQPEADIYRPSRFKGIVNLSQTITIPAEYKGHRAILRFNGTANETTLYVNGKEIRSHWGNISSWSADITDAVTPGEEAKIVLKIDKDDKGLARYTPHVGCLSGDVQLYAVPETYLQRMRIETTFDNQYCNATLQLWLKTSNLDLGGKGKIRVQLTSADGKKLKTTPAEFVLPADLEEFKYDLSVANPKKWDAEHPNLYTMRLSLIDEQGQSIETIERKMGFRQVELRENQVFINGDEAKFRGVWGVDDAKAIRDMNCNHSRQKFNLEQILDSCDYYGVYILQENCVDFAKNEVEANPKYASQWMALIEDLMERSWNHPCVVMWGLGNESWYGANTIATNRYVKNDDKQRPTMYSWGNRIKDTDEIPFDVYSCHYPTMADPDLDLSLPTTAIWHSESNLLKRPDCPKMPILADECCHVCLTPEEAQRDPNVRNFWGESIKHFWDKAWDTKGALGGDQFGIFSEVNRHFTMPEPWLMRKAYSPVAIRQRDYTATAGKPLEIEMENRFCHTNLNECTISWSIDGKSGTLKGPNVAPRGKGKVTIPFKNWSENGKLMLEIKRADGFQVDEYALDINPVKFTLPAVSSIRPEIEDHAHEIIVKGKDFDITFSKYTGLIDKGTFKGKTVLTGGPCLQFVGSNMGEDEEFWLDSISAHMEGNEAVVKIDGVYSPIHVGFLLRIDGEGLIRTTYTIKQFPDAAPTATTIPWDGASIGGYSEIGLSFKMPGDVDRIEWQRRGLWSIYPDDHVGRETGIAYREPKQNCDNWKDLAGDHKFSGEVMAVSTVSNDFRASREYFRNAIALLKGSKIGLEALSEEKEAVRMQYNPYRNQTRMIIDNLWNYPVLGIGNWMKPVIKIEPGYTNTVYLRMTEK